MSRDDVPASTIAFSECGSDRSSTSSGPSGSIVRSPTSSRSPTAISRSRRRARAEHQRQRATDEAEHRHDLASGRADRVDAEPPDSRSPLRRDRWHRSRVRRCRPRAAYASETSCLRTRTAPATRPRAPAATPHRSTAEPPGRTAPRPARELHRRGSVQRGKRTRTAAPMPRPSNAIDSAVDVACELPMYA